jgi:splicing factor 3A subunit 3
LDKKFSGEESFGRFLDLHELHDQYLNLKDVKRINYLTYLEQMEKLELVPVTSKNGAYRNYLANLRRYLEDYLTRAQPLLDQEKLRKDALEEFERHWRLGSFPGWTTPASRGQVNTPEQDALFCQACKF